MTLILVAKLAMSEEIAPLIAAKLAEIPTLEPGADLDANVLAGECLNSGAGLKSLCLLEMLTPYI